VLGGRDRWVPRTMGSLFPPMPSGGSFADAVVGFYRESQNVPTEQSWWEVQGEAWYPGWLVPDPFARTKILAPDPLSDVPRGAAPDFDVKGEHVESVLLTFSLVALYRRPGVRVPLPGMFELPRSLPLHSQLLVCGKPFLSVASRSVGVGDVEVNVPTGPCPGIVQYFTTVDVRMHVDAAGCPCLPTDPLFVETVERTLTLARMRWYQVTDLDRSKPSYIMWRNRFEAEKFQRRARGPVTGVSKHAQYAFVPIHRLRNVFVKLSTPDGSRFAIGRVPQVIAY
jgi:hypothetical protein